jgi:hypothetical protein
VIGAIDRGLLEGAGRARLDIVDENSKPPHSRACWSCKQNIAPGYQFLLGVALSGVKGKTNPSSRSTILGAKSSMASTYARIASTFNLTRAPAVANRNRVHRLEELLRQEARRRAKEGGPLRVPNVGCGPATEVERFVTQGREAGGSHLTLVDFNEETLAEFDSVVSIGAIASSTKVSEEKENT